MDNDEAVEVAPPVYHCGLCQPDQVPMTLDPRRGYLCPRHGDGLTDVSTD